MKTNRTMIDRMFARLCALLGVTVGSDHGCWYIDHDNIYGGYIIHEVANDSYGVSFPLLLERLPAGEFFRALTMAVYALERNNAKA